MSQVDGWYCDDEWGAYTVIGCSSGDCNIRAKAFLYHGPWRLFEENAHLLEEPSDRDPPSQPPG